jgi:DNA-binding Xre family transcriptional regulator
MNLRYFLSGTGNSLLLKIRRHLYASGMRNVRLRVKEVARAKGMSMTRLHLKSEVAYTTIRDIVRTGSMDVTLRTLVRLAEALEVSVCDLIEELPDEQAEEE